MVEEVAGWSAGGRALPGIEVIGWVHYVRKDGRRASRVKGVTSKVMGMVQQRVGSSQEGLGGVWAVSRMDGSFGRLGWWAAGQNSL